MRLLMWQELVSAQRRAYVMLLVTHNLHHSSRQDGRKREYLNVLNGDKMVEQALLQNKSGKTAQNAAAQGTELRRQSRKRQMNINTW